MNILLVGACGRMGRMVSEAASEHGDAVVCGVDLAPAPMPFPVVKDFSSPIADADVMIDFSSAEGLEERLAYAAAHGLPAVLAATGYSDADLETVKAYAERIPLFRTGNLSLGVNLLQLLVRRAASVLGENFDVEIVERHHNMKKDAPSGTALMLAESVRAGEREGRELVFGRHGNTGARDPREIGIHAVRGGTIVGEHEVMFAGEDEIVTLSHSARSRKVFAAGALRAAAWLIGKPAGQYDMDDLVKELVR